MLDLQLIHPTLKYNYCHFVDEDIEAQSVSECETELELKIRASVYKSALSVVL